MNDTLLHQVSRGPSPQEWGRNAAGISRKRHSKYTRLWRERGLSLGRCPSLPGWAQARAVGGACRMGPQKTRSGSDSSGSPRITTSYLSVPAVRMWGDGEAHADSKPTPPRTATGVGGGSAALPGLADGQVEPRAQPVLRLCGRVRLHTPCEGVMGEGRRK